MSYTDNLTVDEIEARLAIFLKPSAMPVTLNSLNAWVEEADESNGYVRAESYQTKSGNSEHFSL